VEQQLPCCGDGGRRRLLVFYRGLLREHDGFDVLLASLDETMNGPQKPDFLDYIKITMVNLGTEFPILSNCRVGYQ